MKIRTEWQGLCWSAVDDDTYDGADDSRSPMGIGQTEAAAINDLKQQLADDHRGTSETDVGQ